MERKDILRVVRIGRGHALGWRRSVLSTLLVSPAYMIADISDARGSGWINRTSCEVVAHEKSWWDASRHAIQVRTMRDDLMDAVPNPSSIEVLQL